MILSVRLQNFRCFSDRTFEFDEGVNLIVGKNGVGKTSVLEAIYVVLNKKSWRGKDDSLIKHGCEWARVDAKTRNHTYSITLDQRSGRLQKKQLVDTEPGKDVLLKTVLFEPEFVQTFTSQPDKRRSWLDDLLEKIYPEFGRIRENYKRVLQQRNRQLKQSSFSSDSMFVWNLKLSEYGAQIAKYRRDIIEQISKQISAAYNQVSNDKSVLDVIYRHQFPVEMYSTAHLKKLEESIEKDTILGFTTSGPHREDIEFNLNNQPVLITASRGEVRTIAMALKKIEIHLLDDENTIELYDDAFSELDTFRSTALFKNSKNQKIITSAEEGKIGKAHTTLIG